jgi:hypothetical protein
MDGASTCKPATPNSELHSTSDVRFPAIIQLFTHSPASHFIAMTDRVFQLSGSCNNYPWGKQGQQSLASRLCQKTIKDIQIK